MPSILIVDDETDFLKMTQRWFTGQGWEVHTADSAGNARRILKEHLPDLLLLDVNLPDEDGISLCKALRANPATRSMPVVLVTALDPAVGRMQAISAGASDYITKPLSLQDLMQRIGTLLGDEEVIDSQADRLLNETVQTIIGVLGCNLAWILSHDSRARAVNSRAVATSRDEIARQQFIQATGGEDASIPLESGNPIAASMLSGAAEFNLSVSNLRTRAPDVYRAAQELDLYYVSLLPLQTMGTPLGMLVLGSREPLDVETSRGHQLTSVVANQAAMVVDNARLFERMRESEQSNRSERAFRQMLLDTMADGLLAYDAMGLIRFVNRRVSNITGRSISDLRDMAVEELFVESDRAQIRSLVQQEEVPKTAYFRFHIQHVDGRLIPVVAVQARSSAWDQVNAQASPEAVQRVLMITDLSDLEERDIELRVQTRRLQALNRITHTVNSTLTSREMMESILDEARSAFEAEVGFLLTVDETDGGMHISAIRSMKPRQPVVGATGLPPSLSAYFNALPGAISAAIPEADPTMLRDLGDVLSLDLRSVAVVPMIIGGNLLGYIGLANASSGIFTDEDTDLLEAMARSAAVALENARLFRETQVRLRELKLLLNASEAAASTLSIQSILEKISDQLIEALRVQAVTIAAYERGQTALFLLAYRACATFSSAQSPASVTPEQAPALFAVFEKPQQVLLSDDPSLGAAFRADMARMGVRSVLILPIMGADGTGQGVAQLCYTSMAPPLADEDFDRCRVLIRNQLADQPPAVWGRSDFLAEFSQNLIDTSEARTCILWMVEENGQSIRIAHESSRMIWSLDNARHMELDHDGIRYLALMEKTPVVTSLNDIAVTEKDRAYLPPYPDGKALIVPLVARGEVMGVIQLVDVDPQRAFSEGELSLAQAISSAMANALANTQLYTALLKHAAQLEAAYNDLREADRLKEEWIQNVSHELRTPLTSILGYIDLILAEGPATMTPNQYSSIEAINVQARRLSRGIEDLLALQKMTEEPIELTEVNLAMIARSVIHSLEDMARQRGITVRLEAARNLRDINADPSWLYKVFDKLLGNALKFTPTGGEIVIAIQDNDNAQLVTVRDTGIGIPIEEHTRIWRRFYQVDGSMTRQYGGMGLGLALAKWIVEQHHGRIWVDSEPGRGSSFSFIIPVRSLAGLVRPIDQG